MKSDRRPHQIPPALVELIRASVEHESQERIDAACAFAKSQLLRRKVYREGREMVTPDDIASADHLAAPATEILMLIYDYLDITYPTWLLKAFGFRS